MSDSANKGYEPVAVPSIPRDAEGNCLFDLYVYLPTPKKFIVFVPAGEKFTLARKMALEKHVVPALFVRSDAKDGTAVTEPVEDPSLASPVDYEVMGAAGQRTLQQIFKALNEPSADGAAPAGAIQALEKVADEIVTIVAPDVEDLKAHILQNAQNVWVMNDSSAIITLSVMFAFANGFDSQKSLRDIIYSSLVMDLPLISMGAETIDKLYMDASQLPKETIDRYQNHPVESYRLAKQSLRYFTEGALALILNHHEYKNGQGFPRKVRSESLAPLVKVFAASVNAFEILKRSQLLGQSMSLADVIQELSEPGVEPHLQRHSREIIDRVNEFMGYTTSGNAAGGEPMKKAA